MLPDGRKDAKGSVERSAPVLRGRHFSGASLITLIGMEFDVEKRQAIARRASLQGGCMSAEPRRANEMRITLQVGTTLRIKNTGDVVVDNPELELATDEQAADAVLIYSHDPESGDHILRLVEPVALRAQQARRRGA